MRTEEDNQRSSQLAAEIHEFLMKKSYGKPDDEIIALGQVLGDRLSILPAQKRDARFVKIMEAPKELAQDSAAENKG